jgi:prepilin-type N-terminal cleavage/methylation domain-containing protein
MTNSNRKSRSKQGGFTLVEVVISLSILTVILSTAYSAITQIISTKKLLDDKRDNSLVASSIVRRLSKELQLAVSDSGLICQSNTSNNSSATKILFLGDKNSDGAEVTFIALEGGQYLPDGGTHTGKVQISYKLLKDPERRQEENVFSLVREEIPYISPPATNDPAIWQAAVKKSCNKRMVFPIADNIRRFELKYYDVANDQWVEEWDPTRKEVPAMIYYSVTGVSPLGNEETYATMVPIGANSI